VNLVNPKNGLKKDIEKTLIKSKMDVLEAKELAKKVGDDKKKLNELCSSEVCLQVGLIELEIEQLAHLSPEEEQAIEDLLDVLIERKDKPEPSELALLRKHHTAADIALFGRMLASSPSIIPKPPLKSPTPSAYIK
jgi:CRISPR system Cascade subunit CasC